MMQETIESLESRVKQTIFNYARAKASDTDVFEYATAMLNAIAETFERLRQAEELQKN